MSIRKEVRSILILLSFFIVSACSDDDSMSNSVADEPSGEVSFTIDGETKSFEGSALQIITDDGTPNSTTINIDDPNTTLQVVIQASPRDSVTYEASNLEDENDHVIVSVIYSEGDGTFFNTEQSSGEVSITNYTDAALKGSFNFSLEDPVSGETITIENGSFNELLVTDSVQ